MPLTTTLILWTIWLLARRQEKSYTALWAAFYAIQLGGTLALAETHGILGAAYSYLAAGLFLGTAGLFRYAKAIARWRIVAENSLFVLSCLGAVASAVMLERYGSGLAPRILLSAAWCIVVGMGYFYKPVRERLFR